MSSRESNRKSELATVKKDLGDVSHVNIKPLNKMRRGGMQQPYSVITPLDGLNEKNEIFIKRDDLLPFSFGGNKVRIAQEFYEDMIAQGKNCMIGYGGLKSNLCRILSNLCAKNGVKCHIVTSTDSDEEPTETNNSLLVQSFGTIVHRCSKTEVAKTVSAVMEQCRKDGYDPYYIYGDENGNGNEATPVKAYVKAHREILDGYDYIFLATGTGMSHAGMLVGKYMDKTGEKIVGISVARDAKTETEKLKKYISAYYDLMQQPLPTNIFNEIVIEDEYLCGGYGKYNAEITDVIKKVMLTNGVALDTTYTGKAFWGMLSYLKKNNISGKKVLFVHTGGLPIFFDNLKAMYC